MRDAGHDESDALLKKMQAEVEDVYRTAQKDLQKKIDDYVGKFAKDDAKKQKLVANGKMSQEDYEAWKQKTMLTGKQYRQMLNTVSTDLTNADKIARSIINGYTPEAYAVGMNYGTYQIESGTTFNTNFTLYNRETVERLLRDDPQLLPMPKVNIPKDKAWNYKHIKSAVTQGIIQGESMPKIAKRLENVVGMDKRAAIRNARTAVTGAENAGRMDSFYRAKEMGIGVKKQWLATPDGRTRDSHVEIDLEVVELEENFSNGCEYPGDPGGDPAEVYNCFIPSTSVAIDSDIIRSYKHYYSGEVISIESACGVKFTCTPNHPILTTRGWVKANLLNEGDNIIVTSVSNKILARRNPNINHVFSRFDAVHKALNKFGAKRTCALSVNFHGDIPTTEVEIITKKRFLRNHRNPRVFKAVDKFFLKSANKAALFFGTFLKHFGSIGKSSLGDVGGRYKAFPFFRRSVRHTNKHGFRSIANSDVVLSEYSINDLPTDVEFAGESLDRLAGNVFADKIVSVNVGVFNGHVYNLQTKNNYYFVNDIIPQSREKSNGIFAVAHNCRCAMIPWLDRFGDKFDGERMMNLHGMTYDEWKEGHNRQAKETDNVKFDLKNEVKEIEGVLTEAKNILPVNQITDENKFFALTYDFEHDGYSGRPIVVGALGDDQYQALTGSHRIFAARQAGIEIPTVVLPYDEHTGELFSAFDDDERAKIAEELFQKGFIDRDAYLLLKYEASEQGVVSAEYRAVIEKKAELYQAEQAAKIAAEKAEQEAAKKAEEKSAKKEAEKRESSLEMQEYKDYLQMIKEKYGEENMWREMTDNEMDTLDRLERIAYRGR